MKPMAKPPSLLSRETPEPAFAFGQNWSRYLVSGDQLAMEEARESVVKGVGQSDLTGQSFLDVGCGSGIFSLAARTLGATVLSFDVDSDSVQCAARLKGKYFPGDPKWEIKRGSILDEGLNRELRSFDVVYAWGVLHHTGDMWKALDIVSSLPRVGGRLVIAIYNDQGHWSRIWLRIKEIYNRLPKLLRIPFVVIVALPREIRSFAFSVLTLQPSRYVQSWTQYKRFRGMSKWHDLVDWVGGLPFEVAKPEEIIFFFRDRSFELLGMITCAGEIGCNEYIFIRRSDQKLISCLPSRR